jgi:type I restriction enzyme S subunit
VSKMNGLPASWKVASLAEIGQWYGGGTPSKANPAYWDNGTVPWFSPKDMKKFRLVDSEDHVTSAATEETNVTPFPKGTILIVVRSGILVRTLPVAISEVPATMNQDMKGLCPFENIDPAFVAYFLTANESSILQECSKDGTTVASIEVGRLKSVRLPVPSLNEQRRIVAKIEELFSDLDAAVAALERVQAKLKRYRAAVLKAAVEGKLTAEWRAQRPATEPAEELLARILAGRRRRWEEAQLTRYTQAGEEPPKNWREKYQEPAGPDTSTLPKLPDGWCWATLPQVGTLDRGRSRHRPRNAPHLYGGPYPFIQTGDIRHADTFIRDYKQTYSEAGLEQSRLWPRGTLCITIAANIAETAILDFDACFPDSVVGFQADESTASTRYVELYLRTVQARLENLAPATAQKNINLETLMVVAVACPPLHEQFEIVAQVDQRLSVMDEVQTQVEANLKRAARLRQSILKRAFEGRLVPQDPTDEPAAALLQRTKGSRAEARKGS